MWVDNWSFQFALVIGRELTSFQEWKQVQSLLKMTVLILSVLVTPYIVQSSFFHDVNVLISYASEMSLVKWSLSNGWRWETLMEDTEGHGTITLRSILIPIHIVTPKFSKIHFNFMLPFTLRSSK